MHVWIRTEKLIRQSTLRLSTSAIHQSSQINSHHPIWVASAQQIDAKCSNKWIKQQTKGWIKKTIFLLELKSNGFLSHSLPKLSPLTLHINTQINYYQHTTGRAEQCYRLHFMKLCAAANLGLLSFIFLLFRHLAETCKSFPKGYSSTSTFTCVSHLGNTDDLNEPTFPTYQSFLPQCFKEIYKQVALYKPTLILQPKESILWCMNNYMNVSFMGMFEIERCICDLQ